MTLLGGYGDVGFGRHNFGNAQSEYEPRFFGSDPSDAGTGISVFQDHIWFSVYCFSSRADASQLLVEISEDGGGSYSDAYTGGAFVAPYNGSDSRIDAQQGNGQEFIVYVHKTAWWADDKEIRVRVTSFDNFGNEATKETPVEW